MTIRWQRAAVKVVVDVGGMLRSGRHDKNDVIHGDSKGGQVVRVEPADHRERHVVEALVWLWVSGKSSVFERVGSSSLLVFSIDEQLV